MPSDTKVFEASMTNGVKYEVHEAQGFSNRAELAVKVEGEIAVVLIIERKRSKNIEVRPTHARAFIIKHAGIEEEPTPPPNVDDVIPDS